MKKATIAIIVVLILAGCAFGGWKYHENSIVKMQDTGVEMLRAAVNLDDYREEERNAISAILDNKEAAIRECREQEAINVLLEEAAAEYADFRTDAALTAEEEVAKRLAEIERKRKEAEEAAKRQAELEAQQAAAAAARRSSGGGGGGGSRNGCVGGGKDVFN